MRHSILAIILMLSFIAETTYAWQVKSVADNQNVSINISAKALSRIFVLGDRIQDIRGIEGTYELLKDEKQGEIFIKPLSSYHHQPFNLFISTERGHAYNLLLNPKDISAESIELNPLPATPTQHWEKNSVYVDRIIDLIKGMANEIKVDGFTVTPMDDKEVRVSANLTMQLVSVYKGNSLQGEIWSVRNLSQSLIQLNENMFIDAKTRAISMEDNELGADEALFIYKVVSHD